MTDEPASEPTRERDPKERKTLEDALHIATAIVDSTGPVDSEQYVLAAGFLVLCGDMAAMLDAAKKATHFCGWCQRANADSRVGLATYTLEEVREHTQRCEHNPLVAALSSARTAARTYAHYVNQLGLAADDNDPKVMATAEPIGAAQAELYIALGIYEERRPCGFGVDGGDCYACSLVPGDAATAEAKEASRG